MHPSIHNIFHLLAKFKKLAATCAKCGDYNEYVPDDPNFVCYKCKTEKARMFGADNDGPKLQEPQKLELSKTPREIAHFLMKELRMDGFSIGNEDFSDPDWVGFNVNFDQLNSQDMFVQKSNILIKRLGFSDTQFSDGTPIFQSVDRIIYTKNDIMIVVNENYGGIIIRSYQT